jgi:hypothetical protein
VSDAGSICAARAAQTTATKTSGNARPTAIFGRGLRRTGVIRFITKSLEPQPMEVIGGKSVNKISRMEPARAERHGRHGRWHAERAGNPKSQTPNPREFPIRKNPKGEKLGRPRITRMARIRSGRVGRRCRGVWPRMSANQGGYSREFASIRGPYPSGSACDL